MLNTTGFNWPTPPQNPNENSLTLLGGYISNIHHQISLFLPILSRLSEMFRQEPYLTNPTERQRLFVMSSRVAAAIRHLVDSLEPLSAILSRLRLGPNPGEFGVGSPNSQNLSDLLNRGPNTTPQQQPAPAPLVQNPLVGVLGNGGTINIQNIDLNQIFCRFINPNNLAQARQSNTNNGAMDEERVPPQRPQTTLLDTVTNVMSNSNVLAAPLSEVMNMDGFRELQENEERDLEDAIMGVFTPIELLGVLGGDFSHIDNKHPQIIQACNNYIENTGGRALAKEKYESTLSKVFVQPLEGSEQVFEGFDPKIVVQEALDEHFESIIEILLREDYTAEDTFSSVLLFLTKGSSRKG